MKKKVMLWLYYIVWCWGFVAVALLVYGIVRELMK